MVSRVLVTGGAGFIGSHTVDALIARGFRVRILDNLQQPVHRKGIPAYLPEEAEFICGDVRDSAVLRSALDDVDVVYHFAAYQDYLPFFSQYFDVNCVSTALIYELIVTENLPVKKVIVASSQAVLGEGLYSCSIHGDIQPDIRPDEQLRQGRWEHYCPDCGNELSLRATSEKWTNPCNQYALSKHSEESIALSLGRRYSIPSVALRYSIVQGPRQSFYNAYSGAMRIFAMHLLFDRSPTIYEDGGQIRDYVNIRDVVEANLLVLDDERADYGVFNVGGGTPLTVREFYGEMLSVTGKQIDPKIGTSYRFGDTRHILSDISALTELGWKPRRSVVDSISAYWAYLKEQTDIDDILEHAEKTMQSLTVVREIGRST